MTRLACLWLLTLACLAADTPAWIWGPTPQPNELRHFRKLLILPEKIRRATLTVACDNGAVVSLNDQAIGRNDTWSVPSTWNVARVLVPGENLLAVVARNQDGAAGLLARLEWAGADGTQHVVVSDATWETSSDGAGNWVSATELGPHGIPPWGNVLVARQATRAGQLQVLPGFSVELLRSAETGEGSWVALAFDPKGRIILSPQGTEPLQRVTLAGGKVQGIESLNLPVRGAMGLLWAFDSLYVNGRGTNGLALYRLRDTRKTRDALEEDHYDSVVAVRRWSGDGGEHGPHGVVAGPDGKIYAVCGNFVDVPQDLAPGSPVRNYADDLVLPRMEDGNGFGRGRKPPGGFVLRMNPDGTQPEIFSAGQRNVYDIAFNDDGELFAFDSDMEWDWGLPWYRPIRVLHCFAGADHGFREGSGKWPEHYPDSMPSVLNVGIGSPTGVTAGRGAQFPERYQRALYMMDWAYGRILAVHLKARGSSYGADYETLVKGRPLSVTDLGVGPDGALYFITGGRGTQSGLYRVTYTGGETITPAGRSADTADASVRARRRSLERWEREEAPDAVAEIWPELGSTDLATHFVARVALERQAVDGWRGRALAESNVVAGLTALLALARTGTDSDQRALLKALGRWPMDTLDKGQVLLMLRVIEVAIARHGVPEGELRTLALQKLGRQFPAGSWAIDRELSSLLVALDSPEVVAAALKLRDEAPTQAEAIHYQSVLAKAHSGWTPELRRRYFIWFHRRPEPTSTAEYERWFAEVGLKPSNGASFEGFMKAMKHEAMAGLSDGEKGELAAWITGAALTPSPTRANPAPERPARVVVSHWKMEQLEPKLGEKGRDTTAGRKVYGEAQCTVCHRLGNEGGAVGPDLTGAGARYSRADLLRSLLEPSAVVSEQYQATLFSLKDGETVAGRLVDETADRFVVLVDPLTGGRMEIRKSAVQSREASHVSPMPEGLVDTFSADEVLDLVEYLAAPTP